jgi:pilus assembly protein CpaC
MKLPNGVEPIGRKMVNMTPCTASHQRSIRFRRLPSTIWLASSLLAFASPLYAQTGEALPVAPAQLGASSGVIQPIQDLTPPRRLPPEVAQPSRDLDEGGMRQLEDRFLAERVDPGRTMDLQVGRPAVLRFRQAPFRDQVGDPNVVEVLNLTETELSINGLEVGSTVLNLWFESPNAPGGQEVLSYLVRVSEDPDRSRRFEQLLTNLEKDVNRAFPNSVVKLSYVGSEVLVRGKAKDVDEATQILRIVSQSLPTTSSEERLATLEAVRGANSLAASDAVRAASFQTPAFPGEFALPPAFVDPLLLDPDRIAEAGGIEGIARGRTITGANAAQINSRVVNMLEIAGVHQVQLKVTLAEVVRDAGRSLVTDLQIGDSVVGPGSANVDFSAIEGVGQFAIDSNRFFLQVDALKRLGLARSLAEPNLTSLNGQPANFLVGGQFPILESTSTVAAVNQNIRFVPFGVQLMVIPTVSDGDRIRLNLTTTVSERAGVGIGGGGAGGGIGGGIGGGNVNNDPSQPPSLSTRSFQTTVELRSSESLAVAGLIRTSLVNSSVRVPFLGDIPVVGNLFSNNRNSYQEQELILVVTPQLVSPVPANCRQALPGSDSFEPDDLEFYLHGSMTGHIAEDYRTPVRSDLEKMHAFRRAEQKYIIGRPGHTSGQVLPLPKSNVSESVEVIHDPNF